MKRNGLAMLLGVVALLGSGCSGTEEGIGPLGSTDAGSTVVNEGSPGPSGELVPELPYDRHLTEDERAEYNTRPATSGAHYGFTVQWGVHDRIIPDEILVHNLEHGGVGIHYNCPEGCDELIRKLAEMAGRYDKVVMSPYADMDSEIALTAWTFIDRLGEFDEKRITDFIEDHMSSPVAPEPFVK